MLSLLYTAASVSNHSTVYVVSYMPPESGRLYGGIFGLLRLRLRDTRPAARRCGVTTLSNGFSDDVLYFRPRFYHYQYHHQPAANDQVFFMQSAVYIYRFSRNSQGGALNRLRHWLRQPMSWVLWCQFSVRNLNFWRFIFVMTNDG